MTETLLKYTSRCQAWDDIVEFNNLAKKTFGTQFAPLVDEFKIDGRSDPMYGYTITWWVHPKWQTTITTRRIKNMCKKLVYGHHIIDFLEVEEEAAR